MSRFALVWTVIVLCPAIVLSQETPQVLAKGLGADVPKQPQAWVSSDGVIDIVYAVGEEVRVSTSRDRGATFTPAASSIRCSKMMAGMRRGPRIGRTKSAIVVSAIGGKLGGGKDGDLLCWQSTDDGSTWSDSVIVNDVPAAAREGLHGMTVGSNGDVTCVWLDLRNKKTEIYTASSSDSGETWSKNILAYHSPGGSVCECCHPSVIATGESNCTILFRNQIGGKRDMFLLTSNDGKKFSEGRKLGNGTWNLNACPMDGGMLASDGKDQLVTVWRREKLVFATFGNGSTEKKLGTGQQPWATWSAAGPVFVWTQGGEGALSMQIGLDGAARQLDTSARDPVVASSPDSDFAIICWETKQGGNARILTHVVPTPAKVSK